MTSVRLAILSSLLCTSILVTQPALAESDAVIAQQLQAMQEQIQKLQAQIKDMHKTIAGANNAAKAATVKADAAKAAALNPPAVNKTDAGAIADAAPLALAAPAATGGLQNKNIKLTLGGFTEVTAIGRTHSESTDEGSGWTTAIPFPYLPANHLSEFRESARCSRLSLLAQGTVNANTDLTAYVETDFTGAAHTSNSTEANGYVPKLRQAFVAMDRYDLGLHVLGGQAWSLITLNRIGIIARQENVPQTIDTGYIPGFNYTRNSQFRVVKDFDDNRVWAGISLESPQAIVSNGPNNPTGGAPIYTLAGGSGFDTTNSYTTDLAPDVVVKLAFDPGYGHYEVYGLGRFFRDRTHVGGTNDTIMGGGAGVGAILPIIDKKLEFQVSGLAGRGIGRYGPAQLPDVTTRADGSLATIGEIQALVGLNAHPTEKIDLYLYSGIEQAQKNYSFNGAGASHAFGYGNPFYNNSGCDTEGAAATSCVANTKSVEQIAVGGWYKFYKGSYGMMEIGASDSYTTRYTFSGINSIAPSVNENVTMVSFRYYPF